VGTIHIAGACTVIDTRDVLVYLPDCDVTRWALNAAEGQRRWRHARRRHQRCHDNQLQQEWRHHDARRRRRRCMETEADECFNYITAFDNVV